MISKIKHTNTIFDSLILKPQNLYYPEKSSDTILLFLIRGHEVLGD